MSYKRLENKEEVILNSIVEVYLQTGKPVSSASLAQKLNNIVSPATIRNVMAELEKEGCLYQPHTSAGRIPTDLGIKFYVNHLLDSTPHDRLGEVKITPDDLAVSSGELDGLLLQASQVLANNSDNLAFVVSPHISQINFDQVMFTQNELDQAALYLNQHFRGKNLSFVRDYLFRELPKLKLKYEDLIEKLITLLRSYPSPEEENKVFLQGTARLLDKVELFDFQKLKSLFRNFEQKANLARLLSDLISLERVKVILGSELKMPEIADCCLILSHYGDQRQVLGSLGIIGPKRLPYEKIIPLVDQMARHLTSTISSLERGVMR